MTDNVRVRIAPSPTGFLHVGTVRTALFNWLFARQQGGKFILRVEDTDKERSKSEFTAQILDSLQWMGLAWDEGPVMQSEREGLHAEALIRMLAEGTAFRCFVPQEESRAQLEKAQREEGATAYFSPDRNLTAEEATARAEAGEPHVIRFRCPEGETVFDDIVRGEVKIDHKTVGDIVLARSSTTLTPGAPTYNFVVVVDDADMEITHVIRGEDHISNTPKQILIFEALGKPVPRFAHLPLLHGPDKKKLSKRHGAVTTDEYTTQGILPEALLNHMALLGWSPGDDRELFSVEELIQAFSLERVNRSAAVFDPARLRWFNGQKLRDMAAETFAQWVRDGYAARPDAVQPPEGITEDRFQFIAGLVQPRVEVWDDAVDQLEPFWVADPIFDESARDKHLGKDTAQAALEGSAEALEALGQFENGEAMEQALRDVAEKQGIKFGQLVQPCRVSLTGRDKGPGLTDVMIALGGEETLKRLRAGAKIAAELVS